MAGTNDKHSKGKKIGRNSRKSAAYQMRENTGNTPKTRRIAAFLTRTTKLASSNKRHKTTRDPNSVVAFKPKMPGWIITEKGHAIHDPNFKPRKQASN